MGEHGDAGGKRVRYRGGRDDAIMAALASGMTQREAARAAGVSDRTVRRRLAEPDFMQRIAEIRRGRLDQAAGLISARLTEAVSTLEDLLRPPASPHVRLRAAQILLKAGEDMVRGERVLDRLGTLEAAMDGEIARLDEDQA